MFYFNLIITEDKVSDAKPRMFDLCSAECGMSVCTEAVHTDLYPPTNLLSRKGNLKGFMAEYFIRPPVSLYFHFPFPLVLVKISMDTNIDKQSSIFFSIAGSTSTGPRCSPACTRRNQDVIDLTGEESNQNSEFKHNFIQLGVGSAVDGRIVFSNTAVTGYNETGYSLKDNSKTGILNRISILQLNILRTKESSVPCLKNLKIFVTPRAGRPAEKLLLEQALNTPEQSSTSFSFFGGSSLEDETSGCSKSDKSSSYQPGERTETPEEKIPTEFLDEITAELMLIPMVLPSGKFVDRGTLEKCNESQAMYGGLPRDPFSGRVYTENLKPVFCAELKSRIDAYLTQQNIDTRARTVGDAAAIDRFIKSKNSFKGTKRKHSSVLIN
ncbi:RING finger protein 37 isoform X4 [Eurytemora carolleeae]|uniref:RING finger protein 37 isoform X4 n=1 Tax=Eurytemora carolleeae TaxID=1294199 RepID=UPI000C75E644|nr:RING finger protein 37 isoform X4 [Eurytemora carolleeae]|eukprot:XP_023343683.1 RING finger protein 37-like isoform X4 [Eurytemora affinis]